MELTEKVIRELARLSETRRTVLSTYLNLSNGFDPALQFIARESSRLERLLTPGEKESFETSLSLLQNYLNDKKNEGFKGPGLAFFVDLESGFTRGVKLVKPPEPLLAVDDEAVIQPLALQLNEFEPIGVIMIDAHCTRIFVAAGKVVEKLDTFCEKIHQLSKPGGWSQIRYQRRHTEEIKRFAKDAVETAQTVFEKAGVRRIIIAGRYNMISELEHEFPKSWQDKVIGKVPWDLDSTGDEFLKKIRPLLEGAERKQERDLLDRLVAEIRRHGLGVSGVENTRRALQAGQVDTMILSDTLDAQISEELIKLAEATDAHVEFIREESKVLETLENVGALLRYKIS
jgi:peptide subunit release factor 1 (eRF1)